jgi:hypothetical protein
MKGNSPRPLLPHSTNTLGKNGPGASAFRRADSTAGAKHSTNNDWFILAFDHLPVVSILGNAFDCVRCVRKTLLGDGSQKKACWHSNLDSGLQEAQHGRHCGGLSNVLILVADLHRILTDASEPVPSSILDGKGRKAPVA